MCCVQTLLVPQREKEEEEELGGKQFKKAICSTFSFLRAGNQSFGTVLKNASTATIEKAETIISLRLRNPLHDLCIDYATVKKTNRQVGKQTAAATAMEREVRFPGRLPDEKLDENHLIVVV